MTTAIDENKNEWHLWMSNSNDMLIFYKKLKNRYFSSNHLFILCKLHNIIYYKFKFNVITIFSITFQYYTNSVCSYYSYNKECDFI